MKCLSVSQPYADLVINGKKTIELRTWNTKFRGEFLVHAPLKVKIEACRRLSMDKTKLRTGVIIGKVELYDVKMYHSLGELKSDYKSHLASEGFFHHRYSFLLRNQQELRDSIQYKEGLGFFEIKIQSQITDNDIMYDLVNDEHSYK